MRGAYRDMLMDKYTVGCAFYVANFRGIFRFGNAIGIPVLSGFAGGIGVLLGTTGGYVLGFIAIGLIYLLATKFINTKLITRIIAMMVGLLVCYVFGTAWFITVYSRASGPIGIMTALSWCVFPFIIPDIVKLALAITLASRIRKILIKSKS